MDNAAAIDRTEEFQARGIVGKTDAVIEEPGKGLHIKRGVGDLFIAEDDPLIQKWAARDREAEANRAAGMVQCDWFECEKWFVPRARSGGRPQKYCCEDCRRAADADRKANAPQREQRESDKSSAEQSGTDLAGKTLPEPEELETYDGTLPRQDAVAVKSVPGQTAMGHDVEIEQEDPNGDRPDRITVNSQNVVRLCRMMLWAAGFKTITIATRSAGGFVDLHDGDQAGNHY